MSLNLAIKIAEANTDYPKWRHAAVVTKGGAVQAVGWNRRRNDPDLIADGEHYKYASLHAEADCLKRMSFNAKGCVVYMARIGKNGQIAMSRPCPQCQELLRLAEVKKCVYTVDAHTTGIWKP